MASPWNCPSRRDVPPTPGQTPLRSAGRLVAAIALAALLGCGQKGPRLVPVTGTVTLDGQPVADAGVLFMPVEGGPPASGTTDQQGRFRLRTVNREGAVAGKHRVAVTKSETTGVGDFGAVGPEGIKVIWHVPEKYSRPQTSGLEATVDDGGGEFTFELSSG